jgi:hypothetical protein
VDDVFGIIDGNPDIGIEGQLGSAWLQTVAPFFKDLSRRWPWWRVL